MSNGNNCTNCKYFDPHEPPSPGHVGYCLRYPPQQHHLDTGASFPEVTQEHWCGEFEVKPPGLP